MTTPHRYRAIFERNVPARMRDGTVLYADIWRPEADDKFPVLMTRLPYDKSQPRNSQIGGLDPMRAVGEGYAVIYQDTRGRFTSEGDWSFECESDDGYDSVEWAASLPFSDGNVGMFGISYFGFSQWMAATTGPPHLKAIFPQQMGGGIADCMTYGGALVLGTGLFWSALQAVDTLRRRAAAGGEVASTGRELHALLNRLPDAYWQLPLAGSHPAVSELAPYYDEWINRLDDADFWRSKAYGHKLDQVDVPVFHLGSWYDVYSGPTPRLFTDMRERGASVATRKAQKLVMGPWVHGQMASDVISDLYMGVGATAAFIDLPGLHIRWFDHWLKGKDTGLLDEPPVRLFVMGENVWRDEHEWPLARTEWTNFYLRSGGHANTREGDGRLDTAAPAGREPVDTFLYDPRNPVPTVGGSTVLPGAAIGANAGPKDQARVESRADVLVYSTPPLERDVEVTGPITATLFAMTSALDTDWTVKLVDVHPDGRAYGLADGIIRGRYRNGIERPKLLQPGEVYEYQVDLQATSNVFRKGHRIRVQVSSSNFPRFSRNPNTGRPIPTETELVPALQTILHDADHPSNIRLPIIPR